MAEIDDDRCRCEIRAWLRREPDNAADANAVRVLSGAGNLLGYLPRELAGEYSQALQTVDKRCRVHCEACAFGRRTPDRRWNYGVWLGISDATQLAEALRATTLK